MSGRSDPAWQPWGAGTGLGGETGEAGPQQARGQSGNHRGCLSHRVCETLRWKEPGLKVGNTRPPWPSQSRASLSPGLGWDHSGLLRLATPTGHQSRGAARGS